MAILTNFLRSLLLTIIFCFAAPMILVGIVLAVAFLVGYIPGLQGMNEAFSTQVWQFLAIFGNGTPLQGIFVISLTCSFVGGLFDFYAIFRYKILHLNS